MPNADFGRPALWASFSSDDQRWEDIATFVSHRLVTLEASPLVSWREALRPAKKHLIPSLASIFRDTKQKEQPRSFATETLADYAADQPEELFNLLADAEQFQFPILFAKMAEHKNREKASALARDEFQKRPAAKATEEEKELWAKRQANAAVALLRLGSSDGVWAQLKASPDPRVRSYIVHWLGPLGGDPQQIIQRFDAEPDVTIRRALVLMLGQFGDSQLSKVERRSLIDKLLVVFENEPDAGLRSAADWLLRKWGQGTRLEGVIEKLKSDDKQLQVRKSSEKRQWYVNSQKQTFVIVDPGEFLMGSPQSEPGRSRNEGEAPHRVRIGRRFAIATTEITKERFERFQRARPKMAKVNTAEWVKTEDSPQTAVTWYEAAAYCDWLSEQEKIVRNQWCYDPKGGEYGPGMKAKDKFWELTGYRLPTEAEWEYACRAGTGTSRYYGLTERLLPQCAWFLTNGENHAWPTAILEPNDWGLFDMLGNSLEWCFDRLDDYPKQGGVFDDTPTAQPVEVADRRVLRGGAFVGRPSLVRCADRANYPPTYRDYFIGFRPARTLP